MIFSFAAKYLDTRNKVFVPKSQAKHLYHGKDVSSRHEDFPISDAEEPNSYCHGHRSVGTPDNVKYDGFIDNLTGRSYLAAASAASDKGSVAGTEATPPRLESSSSGAMVRIPFINYI